MLSRFFVFNFSGGPTMLWHRQGYFLLDGAVVFIEGYPLVAPAGARRLTLLDAIVISATGRNWRARRTSGKHFSARIKTTLPAIP